MKTKTIEQELEEARQEIARLRSFKKAASAAKQGTIAAVIQKRREEAGIGQTELAKKAGLSSTVVGQLERSTQKSTSVATLHEIAKALGTTASSIVAEWEEGL